MPPFMSFCVSVTPLEQSLPSLFHASTASDDESELNVAQQSSGHLGSALTSASLNIGTLGNEFILDDFIHKHPGPPGEII